MIVITGGAGFIGSNLASELNKDFELLIVDELDIHELSSTVAKES